MKRPDIIQMIMSMPTNPHKISSLKKMKREDLIRIAGITDETKQSNPLKNEPLKTEPLKIVRKERKLLDFSDDETNDEIVDDYKGIPLQSVPIVKNEPVKEVQKVEEKVEIQSNQTNQSNQQSVKVRPMLKTTGHITELKQKKIKKVSIDDIKSQIQALVKQFSKIMTDDIKAYKHNEIDEEELINQHNTIREEIEDEIKIFTANMKVNNGFIDWYEKLLDVIYQKVARVLG